MANARREPIVPVETKIVLELNEAEASALLKVLNKVGGSVEETRRGYTEAVRVALVGVGVTAPGYGDPGCEGHITFTS
jgi:hypothetical protein